MVTWPVCSTSSSILRRRPSASSRELLEWGIKARAVYSVPAKRSNSAFLRLPVVLRFISYCLVFSCFFACVLFLFRDTRPQLPNSNVRDGVCMKQGSHFLIINLGVLAL